MIARTEQDRKGLKVSGKMLADILHAAVDRTVAGVSTGELDAFVHKEIVGRGAIPVFLDYHVEGAPYPYPAAFCISINDEVVHGIPSKDRIVADGDVVKLDLGLSFQGYISDATVTVGVGNIDADAQRLIKGTFDAMTAAVAAARSGGHVGDIGAAVSAVAKKYDLSVVRDLGGHGTGKVLHAEPFIPNFGTHGQGEKLVDGQVLALEPILALGSGAIKLAADGWMYVTRDHSRTAEFEHTLIVGPTGGEIMTR